MATLIFGALGSLFGPIGGLIGIVAGRQIDQAIFGGGGGTREGPRLKDLAATASSYGTPLPRHFGKMRVPGSIIWATDLVEHSDTQGGGKGQPSVTTYSYSVSFAVALSSRPIQSIGRIWADGNLIRGAAGDLKANGQLRLYTGQHDQPPDPLIQQHEGASRCPAFRGLAYAVFEDLDLSDFFNRIPALSFEVISDSGAITVATIFSDLIADTDAAMALPGIEGFTCEGPLGDTLSALDPIFPMDCDASGELLTIARARLQTAPLALSEAAISVDDSEFGAKTGYLRKREPVPPNPPEVLRYYDLSRDYQPGLQRASGRTRPGQPRTVDLPAALSAVTARQLAEKMARQSGWARETLSWRTTDLDRAAGPGAVVTVPGQLGRWRVLDWEWRDKGVELTLVRLAPAAADAAAFPADAGRSNPPLDVTVPPSVLAAYELPWDGSGSGDAAATFAAVSAVNSGWSGAALYVDHGDGELQSLGTSGRARSTLGQATTVLPSCNPLLFDRSSSVTVELLAADMALADASPRQLAMGANKALLGSEIIQFARAVPLGNRLWRLEALLRGRGGTEWALDSHAIAERFVLLDAVPVALDPAQVGSAAGTVIAAIGKGDPDAVSSLIALQGITLKPLSPVHPVATIASDGSLNLKWTRRARGALQWLDGVDAPLHEQAELWLVTYGPLPSPAAVWQLAEPALTVAPSLVAELASTVPGEKFRVRQQGSYALSEPLVLNTLT